MTGIIPKPIRREPKWHNIALYIVSGLLIAVVLVYAILFYFESQARSALSSLEDQILQVGTKQDKDIEKDVLSKKETIDDFQKFFPDHNKTTGFFSFLENNVHPNVWFTKLDLMPVEFKATLAGITVNFNTLGQQLLILKDQDFVQEVELTDLTINDKGDAEFIFSIYFNPQLFK